MNTEQMLVEAAKDVNARVVAAAIRAGAVKVRFAKEVGVTRPTLDKWQARGEQLLNEEGR